MASEEVGKHEVYAQCVYIDSGTGDKWKRYNDELNGYYFKKSSIMREIAKLWLIKQIKHDNPWT